MLIFPAIDLRGGKCVRLTQGNKEEETIFSEDPLAVAEKWVKEGATWLHIVDLDGAFTGKPQHKEIIFSLVKRIPVHLQVGGGIRFLEDIDDFLKHGIERIVLGTAAILQPEFLSKALGLFGEKITVSIDSQKGKVAIEGWQKTLEKDTLELIKEMEEMGLERIIFTDISRDGMLKGPNIEAIRDVVQNSKLKLIASGGISSLEDLKALKELEPYGVEGIIIGKALYTGAIDLKKALEIAY
jgi:phosphoribosylformimino-5-aminoimidazole carboxamide ribotide isomerase